MPTSKFANGLDFIYPFFIDILISLISSSTDPNILYSEFSSFTQIGKGTPQNLDLERFQSFADLSQFPNLPSPVELGFQLIFLLRLYILSVKSLTLINHDSIG